MTKQETFEALKEILAQICPSLNTSSIKMESLLAEELGLDSLSMMLLAMAAEHRCGITFDSGIAFKTVDDICTYVSERTA